MDTRTWLGVNICDAPLRMVREIRSSGGVRFIDEHTLEARLLKGLVTMANSTEQLVLDDAEVARGSQFPTLWGHGAKPRYLDALLRRGRTPLAVELKVATGGQGRYYRRSLIQAALYSHFIRHAPGLEPWFHRAGLERAATQPCIGVPIPTRWTDRFTADLDLLTRVAARIGVEVHVLDSRATPDWTITSGLAEPNEAVCEQLSWRLAAALAARWPSSMGRVVEVHDCGGFYDQIQLQPVNDRSLDWPSPRPRISLNRPGSASVFGQQGQPQWVWREIWNHLAAGGDVNAAAATIGAIAGLGATEVASGPCFAQLASALLDHVNAPSISWRCAWPGENAIPAWLDRFSAAVARYSRTTHPGSIPTIGRIWAVVRDGEALAIIDQESLRTWVWNGASIAELHDADPADRIARVVEIVRTVSA